jgi:hypothetical protein
MHSAITLTTTKPSVCVCVRVVCVITLTATKPSVWGCVFCVCTIIQSWVLVCMPHLKSIVLMLLPSKSTYHTHPPNTKQHFIQQFFLTQVKPSNPIPPPLPHTQLLLSYICHHCCLVVWQNKQPAKVIVRLYLISPQIPLSTLQHLFTKSTP